MSHDKIEFIPDQYGRDILLKDTDIMPFGKHKGKQLIDVPFIYYQWMQNDKATNPRIDRTPDFIRVLMYIDRRQKSCQHNWEWINDDRFITLHECTLCGLLESRDIQTKIKTK